MIKPYLTVLLPWPSSSAELWRRDEERDEWERRGEKRQEEKDKCSEESWWTPSWTSGVAPALTEPVRWFWIVVSVQNFTRRRSCVECSARGEARAPTGVLKGEGAGAAAAL